MKSLMIYIIQFIHGFVYFLLHSQPLPESVALVEDIAMEYITDLVSNSFGTDNLLKCHGRLMSTFLTFLQVHKAQDIGSKRGKLSVEDFLYLIRKVS